MTMQGKVVVVTGGTSGIGQKGAEALARLGARIVLVARDPVRAAETVRQLKSIAPHLDHTAHLADLSSIAEARRVAAEITKAEPAIDVLVNNAGAMFSRRQVSVDGLELTFALNHMAYYALTEGLLPRLSEAPAARIVNTASTGHNLAKVLDFDDLQYTKGYTASAAYSRSKLCNILYTRELARRLASTKITVNCFHPGLVASRFANEAGGLLQMITPLVKLFAIKPEQGADTLVYLASSPDVAKASGLYFDKRKPVAPSALARDDANATRLWAISEAIADQARNGRGATKIAS